MSSNRSQDSKNEYSFHAFLPDLESDAESPIEYYTCLVCGKDSTAWSMFTCNDCNKAFHPRCVLINPVHPTDPRFNLFTCVDCKCICEQQKSHKRKTNEEINMKDAKKPNEEKKVEVETKLMKK